MDNDNSNPFDDSQNLAPPTDMDIPMQPLEEEDGGQRTLLWALVGIIALGCGLLFAGAFIVFKPDAKSLADRYFPSPTATFTPTATPTPTVTLTPTPTFTPTPNMTAQAYEATAVYLASNWKKDLSETFDTNDHAWHVGEDDDAYAKINYKITNGKYVWDATAHQGFVQSMRVKPAFISDFYFTLEITQSNFTSAADSGIIFRENAFDEYYYFAIDNTGQFSLWLTYKDKWTELIGDTSSSAIRPHETNKVSVLAQGDHFIFFINDQYVGKIVDTTLDKGRVGLGAEIFDPDINVVFEFDNILLKLPK